MRRVAECTVDKARTPAHIESNRHSPAALDTQPARWKTRFWDTGCFSLHYSAMSLCAACNQAARIASADQVPDLRAPAAQRATADCRGKANRENLPGPGADHSPENAKPKAASHRSPAHQGQASKRSGFRIDTAGYHFNIQRCRFGS